MKVEPPQVNPPTSKSTKLLALASAMLLIGASLLLVEPWKDQGSPYGIVDQVPLEAIDGTTPETGLRAGELAPNFRLQDLRGELINLSDLRGRPVLLNFWATWCIFCVAEMQALQEISVEYGDRIAVVGVNVGESRERAEQFANQGKIDYRILLDSDHDVTRAYTIYSMPTTYLVNPDRTIAFVRYGVVTPPELVEVIENDLDNLTS